VGELPHRGSDIGSWVAGQGDSGWVVLSLFSTGRARLAGQKIRGPAGGALGEEIEGRLKRLQDDRLKAVVRLRVAE